MSYYTTVEVQYHEAESLDIGSIEAALERRLNDDGISHDVLVDLKTAFSEGRAMLKVHGAYAVSLMEFIHKQLPNLSFGVRGWGEELRDVWVREFRRGQDPFTIGPFGEDEQKSSGWFTRVPGEYRGWASFIRPRYIRALLYVILAVVILIAFNIVRQYK